MPQEIRPDKNLEVNLEQLHAWVRSGAQLSHSLFNLLRKNGYEPVPQEVIDSAAKVRAKRSAAKKSRAKKDGKKWQAPSRRALLKHRKAHKQAQLSELDGKLVAHRAAKEAAAAAAAAAPAAEDAPADGEAGES